MDAAGNQSPADLVSSWANTLQPGTSYPRILAGPFGPTANKSPSFSLQVGAALSGNSQDGFCSCMLPYAVHFCVLCAFAMTVHATWDSPSRLCRREGHPCP